MTGEGAAGRISRRDVVQTVIVAVLWALCYPLIDVAVAEAPPITIGALRALIAGLVLLAVALWQKRQWPPRSVLLAVALSGLGLTGMGFAGMFLAGGRISPGLATVLANAQPLIAGVLGAIVLGEPLRGRRGVALVVGFGGIIVTSYSTLRGAGSGSTIGGVAFVLLGAAGVALGNVILKRVARRVDAVVAAGWSLLVGAVPLWVLARVLGERLPTAPSGGLVVTIAVLALLGTALASLLWLDLLQRHDLVRLNIFTFLTPVFALLIAAVFFAERLGAAEWLGIGFVLAAVVIVSGSGRRFTR